MLERPDYVIVGGGSAGCVLASRLSENPNTKVLLLEAGPKDRNPMIHIPLMAAKIYTDRLFDWGFDSEPEEALNGRRIPTPRGKILGGSSSINFMAYTRGDRADYDAWERRGLPGWGWRDVLPYFRRAETWEGGETESRGGSGPLGVEYSRDLDPLMNAWQEATEAQGIGRNDDPSSGDIEGIGRSQYTIRNGRRASTSRAYLKPARRRPNLLVMTDAPVVRLLLENRSARGVVVRINGREQEILPTREVILCGGVFKTPQLLMLAGIGRPADLLPHGITPIVNLPVGHNLQDHWAMLMLYARPQPGVVHGLLRADRIVRNLALAHLFGKGPATTIPAGLMGFVRSEPDVPAPDIELMFTPAPPPLSHVWFPGIKRPFRDIFGIRPAILHPFSKGTVSLASTDPQAKVLIKYNAFSDQRDMQLMVRAFKLGRAVGHHSALDSFRAEELLPGPRVNSEEEIEGYIRETVRTVSHSCGTCPMGPDGVLDGNMRPHGIERLRVVDASAMPTIISGHTNACVIMMAERAADLIRASDR